MKKLLLLLIILVGSLSAFAQNFSIEFDQIKKRSDFRYDLYRKGERAASILLKEQTNEIDRVHVRHEYREQEGFHERLVNFFTIPPSSIETTLELIDQIDLNDSLKLEFYYNKERDDFKGVLLGASILNL